MAVAGIKASPARIRRKAKKSFESRIIFAVCFCVFLPIAVVERVLSISDKEEKSQTRASVFQEARASASTCTGYAFMG